MKKLFLERCPVAPAGGRSGSDLPAGGAVGGAEAAGRGRGGRLGRGITEYRLENGLRFLLFPDQSKQQITVNVTYMVGSRHEGYGETGMAHLLEHLVFKGTPEPPEHPRLS